MKYKEQKQLVNDLRTLADFYEMPTSIVLPCPTLNFHSYVGVYDMSSGKYGVNTDKTKTLLKRYIKALGSCVKDWQTSRLLVTKKFSETAALTYSVNRETVCKAVPTGNKITYAASFIPERVEDEVEWVCEDVSLLA